MKKLIAVAILAVTLAGCEASSRDVSSNFSLPEGLQDCRIYRMDDSYGHRIRVVRCPNSTTTTSHSSGKANVSSVVIDGVEYQKVVE